MNTTRLAALVGMALVLACMQAAKAAPLFTTPPVSASYNTGSMHVDVYGTPGKPALVFIPGLACGPWEWYGTIEHFAPGYTIYALTLPGFDGQPSSDACGQICRLIHIERPILALNRAAFTKPALMRLLVRATSDLVISNNRLRRTRPWKYPPVTLHELGLKVRD